MLCGAIQDGRVMVVSSDKTWSTREGNGKPLQCSFLENPMNSMKRQKENVYFPHKVRKRKGIPDIHFGFGQICAECVCTPFPCLLSLPPAQGNRTKEFKSHHFLTLDLL